MKSEVDLCINQFHLRPAPPSPGYCGAFARLFSAGSGGICKFFTTRRRGIFQPRGHSQAFKHARGFLLEYNYTEGFTGKKADWLICQGQE